MGTKQTINRSDMLAARQRLVIASGNGWMGGFGNLLAKELGDWFGTYRWLIQSLIWGAMINGLMTFIMFIVPLIDPESQIPVAEQVQQSLALYFGFSITFGAIGMIILAQDEIIQEKQTGTAAWILSKPVSRIAFVLTKLLSNAIGGLIIITLLPAAIAYLQTYLLTGQLLPVLPFLGGVSMVFLNLFFYASLVIMLGTIFDQRGPVLGIAVVVYLGGLIAAQFTPLVSYVLPVNINKIGSVLALSQPLPEIAFIEVIVTCLWSILFTAIALLRFRREEF